MISASTTKTVSAPRNSAAAIRIICRAVVRRVREEHPDTRGYELFLRLWAAYPFGSEDDLLQQVFHEEVLHAVGKLDDCSGADPLTEQDLHGYVASEFLQ